MEERNLQFKFIPVHKGKIPRLMGGRNFYVEINAYAAAEHGGTHIDAPSHFIPNGDAVDALDLTQLMGPAVVIDISAAARRDADYLLSERDIEQYEAEHGAIPQGAIVLARTGYGRFWGNRERYLGRTNSHDDKVHFPALAPAAAQALVARGIKAFGTDTLSPDNTRTMPKIHQTLLGASVLLIENVANLDQLPAKGANLYGLPMLIEGASGAPVRLFAQVARAGSSNNHGNEDEHQQTAYTGSGGSLGHYTPPERRGIFNRPSFSGDDNRQRLEERQDVRRFTRIDEYRHVEPIRTF